VEWGARWRWRSRSSQRCKKHVVGGVEEGKGRRREEEGLDALREARGRGGLLMLTTLINSMEITNVGHTTFLVKVDLTWVQDP
jgi:hypothetical protein